MTKSAQTTISPLYEVLNFGSRDFHGFTFFLGCSCLFELIFALYTCFICFKIYHLTFAKKV